MTALPPACHKAARIFATLPKPTRVKLARVRRYRPDQPGPERILYPPDLMDACAPYLSRLSWEVRDAIQTRAKRANPDGSGGVGAHWDRDAQGADLELQGVMVALYLRDRPWPWPEGPATIAPEHFAALVAAWTMTGIPLP